MLAHSRLKLLLVALLAMGLTACGGKTPEEHLTAAQTFYAQGDLNAALIEAKNALKKSSKFAEARVVMGDVYAKRADFGAALGEYERAMDLGAVGSNLEVAVARAKLRLGRVQEVIGALEEVDPRDAEMDLLLAEAYLVAGDIPAAKPIFEAYPQEAAGQAGLAGLAWLAGDLERSSKHFSQALEIDPGDADIWLKQGELQLVKSDYDLAIESFQEADKLPGGRVVGGVGVVRALLAQDRLEEAGSRIEQVLTASPDYPLAIYLRGLVSFRQEDMKSAEGSLQTVLSRFPDHGPSQYLMGLVKYKLGQFSQSEDYLKRYLARDESNESVRKLLATVRFDRGDLDGVVDLLNDSESVSQDPQILAMLGSAKLRKGDLSGATSALERAVELAPDMAPFRNQLALSLLSAGKQERAEATLQEAINVDATQFQSDYLIAMLKLRSGEFQEAGAAAAKIIEKSPENPIGFNLLGAVALAEGDEDKARTNFVTALEVSPTFEPAANNLARLFESKGSTDEASSVYQRVLEADPQNEGALIGLAELAVRGGDIPQAARYLERSVAGNAGSLKSRLGLARLQAASGDSDGALATIDEALKIQQAHPDFLALQAQLDLQLGNQGRAEASIGRLQTLLASNPGNQSLVATLAELQMRAGNQTMARRNYERILELSDTPPANALLRLARLDLAESKLKSAAKRLAQLKAIPEVDKVVVQLLEADVAMAQGNNAGAEQIYQGLAANDNRDGVLRLSTLKFRNGDDQAGAKVLEDWLAANENDQGARALLAGAQLAAGNANAALAHYEKLQSSGNPVVLNNLAWIYMEQGDSRAVEVARQAQEAAPQNLDIADTYGWVLIQAGSAAEGVKVLEASLRGARKNPTILYHLGVGYQKMGKAEKAKATLTEALDLGAFPERDAAAEALRTLG